MNREDIIKLAIEHTIHGLKFDEDGLIRFAALVASAAQAKEREACAKVCERTKEATTDLFEKAGAHKCATAIRARGQA